MRDLSATLLAAQKAAFVDALYKIVLTKGEMTYTYEKDRILPSEHNEEMYSQLATIILDNHDGEFDDKDLKGYDAVISYGVITKAGEEYSSTPTLSVTDQQFDSDPNKLTCTLFLEGIPDLMARDEASESYVPTKDDIKTIRQLIREIAGDMGVSLLPCFSHCQRYDVIFDSGYDTLANTYKPKDSFRVYIGGSRLAALRRVIDFTGNVPRFKDGKIHILKPVTSGDIYDYEYNLETGHKFFSKAYKNTLVFPNRVVIQSRPDDDPQYSGEAQIDGYDSLPDNVKKTKYIQIRLEEDQADDIAEALISKAEMGSARGQAEVPLNVGAEVFDYVKVTDQRQGDTRTGNLGYIHRRFGKDKWTMTFGFGNWLEYLRYQAILNKLETYTDIGQNVFEDIYVKNLYAYLDDIRDGPDIYIRQRSLHLDATGVYIQDNVLYTIRLPGQAGRNLTKSDTPPSGPANGDFWIDTNYIPNMVKMWDGDSWDELTAEEVAEFNRGTIFRELKSVALTADGLVILDEVQVGTYGLVLATDIQAGSILLSRTVKDGLWYEESGVAIDATTGIGLYGGEGLMGLRTYPTLADYLAGTNVQCYVGTDGKLYAGGGAVKIDAIGVTFYGVADKLFFKTADGTEEYGALRGYEVLGIKHLVIRAGDDITYDGRVLIAADDMLLNLADNIRPYTNNQVNLGTSLQQWYGGYFASRLKIPVGTDMFD